MPNLPKVYLLIAFTHVRLISAAECGSQKLDVLEVVADDHYASWKDLFCNPATGICSDDSFCGWPLVVDPHHQLVLSREGRATQDECMRGFDDIIKTCMEGAGVIDGTFQDDKATYNLSMFGIEPPQPPSHPDYVTLKDVIENLDHGNPDTDHPPESHSGAGTLLRVQGGCADVQLLIIDDDLAFPELAGGESIGPVCDESGLQQEYPSTTVINSNSDGQETHVKIWGNLPKSKNLLSVPPGCLMEAKWPSHYKDAIFKADGYLYDINGNKIGENMKCEPTKERSPSPGVPNPYVEVPEMKHDVKKTKGNNNGNDCGKTKQEHFLGALSRFKLPGIYTGTTKAVWPLKDGTDQVKKNGGTYFEPSSNAPGADLFQVKSNNWNNKWSAYVSLQCPKGTYIEGRSMAKILLGHYGAGDKHGCGWVELDNGCQIKADTCDGCSDEGEDWALYTPDEMALVDIVTNDNVGIEFVKDESGL